MTHQIGHQAIVKIETDHTHRLKNYFYYNLLFILITNYN